MTQNRHKRIQNIYLIQEKSNNLWFCTSVSALTKRSRPKWHYCCYKRGYALYFYLLVHPLCAKRRRGGFMFCWCFIFLYIFIDFCQTSYLNIYRTDLHGICSIGRTLTADERPEVIFDPSRDVTVATNFVDKSTCIPHLVVRMTFARAAPPAYDKNGNCYPGRMQTYYIIRWTQANQLSNKLSITSRR